MKCNDILLQLEKTFPLEKAYSWDNVGLLVGRDNKEIQKIYVALDVTDSILTDAIKWGADMILTHHPLIFSPLKKINNRNFISSRVVELIRNDMVCYAMHTNYDVVRMADLASEKLGLVDGKPLEPSESHPEEGLGKIGYLPEEMTIQACVKRVKEAFQVPSVKVFEEDTLEPMNEKRSVRKIAVLPGSGKSTIEAALHAGAEVLITGDIGHHEGIDASSQGLIILDAGHYGIEHIFLEDMGNYLSDICNREEIEIKVAAIKHPFQIM